MPEKEPHFLFTRRFLPLFITQFLGAFNDNLFRQAVIILITFRFAEQMALSAPVLTNLAVGLFILPFFLFSALAGQLADKYEKTTQIVWIKLWEVVLTLLGAFAFYLNSLPLMIAILAGLGLQSTFFGPIKYSILPALMHRHELVAANALIQAATYLAILAGLVVGGALILSEGGLLQVSGVMIGLAIVGTLTGRMVPKTGQADPTLQIDINILASTGQLLRKSWRNDTIRRSIISISWIWLLGTIFIAQIPDIVKNRLGGNEQIVTLFMVSFCVGIGAGAFLCSRVLKGTISARLAVPGLYMLAALTTLMFLVLPSAPLVFEEAARGPSASEMVVFFQNLRAFLAAPLYALITGLMLLIAMAAGVVIVPLYAVLQDQSPPAERSRTMAVTNIINSGFMAVGSLVAAALIGVGLTSAQILLLTGLANLLFVRVSNRLELGIRSTAAP